MTDNLYDIPPLDRIDVRTLLPQQPPFVAVGRLKEIDDMRIVTETVVSSDSILVADGHITAPGLVENMAQTCAARIGFYNRYVTHSEIRIGYIGSITGLRIDTLPAVGDTITTEATVTEEIFGVTLVSVTITFGNSHVASAVMKISLK